MPDISSPSDDYYQPSLPNPVGFPSSNDASRPSKRRRVSMMRAGDDETTTSAVSRSDEKLMGSASGLQQNSGQPWDSVEDEIEDESGNDEDADGYHGCKSKTYELRNGTHVPKYKLNQESLFVTQPTQLPYSSPSRGRPPRWKISPRSAPMNLRPKQEQSQQELSGQQPEQQNQIQAPVDEFGEDDPELIAAVMASIDTYNEETEKQFERPKTPPKQTNPPLPPPPPPPPLLPGQCAQTRPSEQNSLADPGFDLNDLPEDAFDSSDMSPSKSPGQPSVSISPNTRFQRPGNSQGTRQTTLFGGLARQSQRCSQASQYYQEPPTQHKLDLEAARTWVYPMNVGGKRDYQFNITYRGLFHNLLVALPTGLGKTFIAATIMLNWFRWTKDAQIVFVAPTKPLVAQQVTACFRITGIPRSATTMLTGSKGQQWRAPEWQNKRVFFMTPQTLVNDLQKGIADPKRIVLLVFDEAHRATGAYAYVEMVKFIQRFNNSFRVLALTATPGATVESVQEVIDGLGISRVEIRTEHSLDIRQYIHSRVVDVETFDNSQDMNFCLDLISKALRPVMEKLNSANAYWQRDPLLITPFGLTQARTKWLATAGRHANPAVKGMILTVFGVLASLAHSVDLLKYHGIRPFYKSLLSFRDDPGKGKYRQQIKSDPNFNILMERLKIITLDSDFIGHPKLEYLGQVVLNHFLDSDTNNQGHTDLSGKGTRMMVFAQYRDSAEDIVRLLRKHEPLLRPHVFVGQTSSTSGSEGMKQKDQEAVVGQFKEGKYNILVATSIGEEGLDIGEVDLIVCYDSSSSPIRMLQRMGRTGRKRQGKIVLLMMKGKESDSSVKARDNYEKMQEIIASGSRFTFNDKCPRILPREIQPVVNECMIEIPIENSQIDELPEPRPSRGAARAKKPKKKFHMPDNVETGFTTASGSRLEKFAATNKRCRQPAPPKSVEVVSPPTYNEVCLDREDERELERRYCNVGGTSPQYVRRPAMDAFPSLQLSDRPIKDVPHGRTTRRLVRTLRKMADMRADCEERFKQNLHPADDFIIREPTPSPQPSPPSSAASSPRLDGVASLLSSPISSRRCDQPQEETIVSSQISLPDADDVFNSLMPGLNGHHSDAVRVEDDAQATPKPPYKSRIDNDNSL